MKRRTLLRTVGAGVVGSVSGCLGMGGEAVVSVQESVTIEPGKGWTKEIPDVSDPKGAVSYIVRSEDKPFDVYFFTDEKQYQYYREYVKGDEPGKTPAGHDGFSKAAVKATDSEEELYEATTKDNGAREPLTAEGPYFFVVDHSSYRMENRVEEFAEPLGVFVDLTVVRKHLPI